jgi:hypothetical protein
MLVFDKAMAEIERLYPDVTDAAKKCPLAYAQTLGLVVSMGETEEGLPQNKSESTGA